jgi:ClpP class serine protease
MGTSDLLWILIVFTFVLPLLQKRWLEASRLRFIRNWERRRGSRLIALIHRQETMSILGFPLVRYIDIQDSEEVLRALRLTDEHAPIDVILHTPGGLALAAQQIAHAIRQHRGAVTVFIPHYAMSGGTLIALAADRIVMDPNAVLGSIDPQIGSHPAASILRAVAQKDPKDLDDETLILADVARMAIAQLRVAVLNILADPVGKDVLMGREKAAALAELFTRGEWTHDHPLSVSDLHRLGLPVDTDVPKEIFEFMRLFPQAAQGRPSVEYIPLPYPTRRPPAPAKTGTSGCP